MPDYINPYVELYRRHREQSANPPRQQPRGVSALEQDIIDHRDNEIRSTIMDAPAPDQVARETRVARTAGQPPAMVGDIDFAEKATNAKRITQVFGRYPAFGRWAANNLRGAVTAQDDHEALGLLGRAWEVLAGRTQESVQKTGKAWGGVDYVNDVGDALAYPLEAAIATVGRPFGININPDDRRAKQRAISQGRINATDTAIAAADARARTGNYWIDATTEGLSDLLPSLAAIGMGVITKNPGAGASMMGLTSASSAYQAATSRRATAFGATL